MPADAAPITPGLLDAALLGAGLAVVGYAATRGAFRERGFAGSPQRRLKLSPIDLGVAFALFLLGPFAGLLILAVTQDLGDDPVVEAGNMLAAYVLGHLPVAAWLWWRAAAQRRGLLRVGLRLPRAVDVLKATGSVLAIALAVSIAVTLLRLGFGDDIEPVAHDALRRMLDAQSPTVTLLTALLAVVAAPLIEEWVFRGLLQTAARDSLWGMGVRDARWPVILFVSLLFTLMHLGAADWQGLPAIFVIGVTLGWWYEKTGSLWPGIIAHAVFNGLMLAMSLAAAGQA